MIIVASLGPGSGGRGPSSASAAPPSDIVKLSGQISASSGGASEVRIDVAVAPGFHINAHRPDEDFLIPTTLSLVAPGVDFEEPVYPAPIARAFAFSEGKKLLVYDGTIRVTARSRGAAPVGAVTAKLRYQACDDERCFPPATASLALGTEGALLDGASGAMVTTTASLAETGARSGEPVEKTPWLTRWLESASLPAALAMTLVLGLTLNLTPCVYPLVSVTIAFFGQQAAPGTRPWPLALAYVAGITLSFALLGLSASFLGGLVGAPLQHPAVLVGFAILFAVLAASCFGWFELRAPAALLARFGTASGGIGGAVLMGLTMGIVAAPCIGPVVLGLLLYVGAKRDLWLGCLLFLTMGLGMGLPYVALAGAAGSIARLPRSGEWLRWMNRLFGVLLLATALYFVSPLLDASLLRFLVPVAIAVAALYLGFLEPSGRGLRAFTAARRIGGSAVLAGAIWLFVASSEAPAGEARGHIAWEPLTVSALDRAIDQRRPAVVEFAADWCLPCLAMERSTFSDAEVAREVSRFAALQADLTESTPDGDALLSHFQVLGVPTIIVYDASGVEVDRAVGYVDTTRFLAMLRRVAGARDPVLPVEADGGGAAPPIESAS